MKLTTSERQHGKPSVPVAVQRLRILQALMPPVRGLSMSSMAYSAFPDFRFRTPQGAALCISRTVRGMHDERLIRMADYGYSITEKGREYLAGELNVIHAEGGKV